MRDGRTLRRKLIELRLTRLIEGELTKDQILELYLNVIYLGNGDERRRGREPRPVRQERRRSSRSPKARCSPRCRRGRAPTRRAITTSARCSAATSCSSLMARGGLPHRRRSARRAPRSRCVIAEDEWRPDTGNEPLALDAVRAFVDSILPDALQGGRRHRLHDARPHRAAAPPTARCSARPRRSRRETQYSGGRVTEPAQGALVAIDPRTGDIRALVGGRRSKRGFNRAFNARRQPGSAFKPFVYAAALARGHDAGDARRRRAGRGRRRAATVWRPANYDGDVHRHASRSRKALARLVERGDGAREPDGRHPERRSRRRAATASRARCRAIPPSRSAPWRSRRSSWWRRTRRSPTAGCACSPRLVRASRRRTARVLWSAEIARRRHGDGSARRVSAHVDAARRRGQRHRAHACATPACSGAGRRQDGHDEQRRRRLVRRLHADARRRRLVRLRHAAADRAARVGRPSRRAGVGRLLPQRLARARVVGRGVDDRRQG